MSSDSVACAFDSDDGGVVEGCSADSRAADTSTPGSTSSTAMFPVFLNFALIVEMIFSFWQRTYRFRAFHQGPEVVQGAGSASASA